MPKRIFVLICLLIVLCMGCAEAAPAEIKNFTWKVHKNSVLRVVFECSEPVKAKAEIKNGEVVVNLNARWKNKKAKNYAFASSTIRKMSVEAKGDKTILHLSLKKRLSSDAYKLFTLKKDVTFKRPDRVVLDIVNGSAETLAAVGTLQINARKIVPTYKVTGGIKGKKICLDAGHGGTDPGAIGKSGVYEKNITLAITKKVQALLEKKGAIVSMTREKDEDVYGPEATDKQELQARVDVAEDNKADLLISLHCNASYNRATGGYSTYYNSKTQYDKRVADSIQKRLVKTANLRDIGVLHANFYVNKRSSMPGALVEMLFLSNAREERLLRSSWFQGKIARAIAEGINDFYKQVGGGR